MSAVTKLLWTAIFLEIQSNHCYYCIFRRSRLVSVCPEMRIFEVGVYALKGCLSAGD